VRQPRHPQTDSKPPPWHRRQAIPAPHQIDRALIERLREAGRRAIAEHRPQIEAVLAA
jgi:hypothetical protein